MEIQDGCLLRIFIGESDKHQGSSLYEWIVLAARAQNLAGATVLRGLMGYGANSVIHTHKIERLSVDWPIVIELVDTRQKLEDFLALVEPHLQGGMATLEKADVRLYRPRK